MSASTFPQRLTKIDDLTRPDHTYLRSSDECYFFGEYTARKDWTFSATNNLIRNLKKPMDRRGRSAEWQWKESAIMEAAAALSANFDSDALDELTFVPVPPSKAKTDPLYDDRLTRLLLQLRKNPPVDVRELILQIKSTEAAHLSETRPRPDEIEALYKIDETCTTAPIKRIAIVDDMLTTGSHFRAAQAILRRRFPTVRIVGIFIARRRPDTSEVDELAYLSS